MLPTDSFNRRQSRDFGRRRVQRYLQRVLKILMGEGRSLERGRGSIHKDPYNQEYELGAMNTLEKIAGKVCEIILPVRQDIFYGKGKSTAICTLADIELLERISRSDLMDRVILVARLFSENKGIERIIKYSIANKDLKSIILCGREARGHLAGQSLIALHKNGVDKNCRIIGALGKDPILNISRVEVDEFRKRVDLIDLINVRDLEKISRAISY